MSAALKRITADPAICHGKPTMRGLRYLMSMILELIAANMTPEETLADYPDLELEDIRAAWPLLPSFPVSTVKGSVPAF